MEFNHDQKTFPLAIGLTMDQANRWTRIIKIMLDAHFQPSEIVEAIIMEEKELTQADLIIIGSILAMLKTQNNGQTIITDN